MATAAALYSPRVLALATALADYPLAADLPLVGRARSTTCGSDVTVGLACNADRRITRIGIGAHACAIGQAAAAIFAGGAAGADRARVAATLEALDAWLEGTAPLPGWPGLDAIAAARDFPARHAAVRLPWTAALDALSTPVSPG